MKEASLGNWAIIKSMNLAEGDTILVEKRNQIIPHVASVISMVSILLHILLYVHAVQVS